MGGRLDIGHAFEWAFLLSRAEELGWPARFLRPATRFLEYGGWFTAPPGTVPNGEVNLDKGSAWKVDYHVTGMCAEILSMSKR